MDIINEETILSDSVSKHTFTTLICISTTMIYK